MCKVHYVLVLLALGISESSVAKRAVSAHGAPPLESLDRTLVERAEASIERGLDWLFQQQSADGGWRSSTYGNMRCGTGNTALVLYALTHAPKPHSEEHNDRAERGLGFLMSNLDDQGFIRAPDNSSDYPTYATALTLLAMERMNLAKWSSERKRLQMYLLKSQKHGEADRIGSGGWGMIGGLLNEAGIEDPASVSATRFALEALEKSNLFDDKTRHAAQSFLYRCQNFKETELGDGGFYFTPAPKDPLNKAGWNTGKEGEAQPRSYGTATADGLCGLLACGKTRSDRHVKAAIAWLRQNDGIADVPGFTAQEPHIPSAKEGLKFYYYAALAKAIKRTPNAEWRAQRKAIIEAVVSQQRSDGSWANSCALMREDDPLVATSFAITAISSALNTERTAK